ncbi:cupin [Mycolicibacterium sp. (ex Dasyatis americana)]|nr:cupin [Mycolicibacterium sp. (ex Dasyatis americana)]
MRRLLTVAAMIAATLPFQLAGPAPARAEDGMNISRGSDRPPAAGPASNFTGQVTVTPLFGATGYSATSGGQVSFTPCARSAWHTHPAGQTLIVTEGTGWVQEWGQPKQQIAAGDVVVTEPGVKHWHGATAETAMTHIAIQDSVDGTNVQWLEHVTDDQYDA